MQRKTKFAIIAITVFFAACKKDYITGGAVEDIYQYKNTSTYDVLKASALYDTLVQVIDAAGLKDKINTAGTTFFAPSDYSIYTYLNKRTVAVQNVDINAKFVLDSLLYYMKNNTNGTRDSLLMYMIGKPLYFDVLTKNGIAYNTGLTSDTAIVSFEETTDGDLGYTNFVSNLPKIQYFTHLWSSYDVSANNPVADIPSDIGTRTRVITSGIITQNGYLNALENSHVLFFYGAKK